MPAETGSDVAALTIAKFDKGLLDRSAFSCGLAPIDNVLRSSLSDQVKDGVVTTWIVTADGDSAVPQAWGCHAEYLARTAKWEQWNIQERLRESKDSKLWRATDSVWRRSGNCAMPRSIDVVLRFCTRHGHPIIHPK